MAGAGRPKGPLQGETPQAEELALWLSRLTKSLSLRELEEGFDYGRTQWGQFRRGEKLIPLWLLEKVVRTLVAEPRRQQMLLDEGRGLLDAAEAAAAGRLPTPSGPPGPQTSGTLQLRLDDARRGQMKAERTLFQVSQLVMMLLTMVGSLQERCQTLEEAQRATVREAPGDGVVKELEETRQRLVQAEAQLEQARREREDAEEIRLGAHLLAAQHERELAELARLETAGIDLPARATEPQTPQDPVEALGLAPLYEYDAVLERSAAQLIATGHDLGALRDELGLSAEEELPGTTPEETVRGQSADEDDSYELPRPAADATPSELFASAIEAVSHVWVSALSADSADTSEQGKHRDIAIPPRMEPSGDLTPKAFAEHLVALRAKAGRSWTDEELADAAWPHHAEKNLGGLIGRWFEGSAFPALWDQLRDVLIVLGVAEGELQRCRRLWGMTVRANPTVPLIMREPSVRALPPSDSEELRRRVRKMANLLAMVAMATLAAAYTAGLQAEDGPSIARLACYGIGLVVLEGALWWRRTTGPKLLGRAMPVAIGLILPWILGTDVWGHGLAAAAGLL
ncbi:hypothetical protein [Streptomyces lavendulae]